jgi:hypothetical protein
MSAEAAPQHCNKCGQVAAVDAKGIVLPHRGGWAISLSMMAAATTNEEFEAAREPSGVQCSGSEKPSRETVAARVKRNSDRQVERENAVRADALIALDALLEGNAHQGAFRYDKLIKMAKAKHKRLFGWPFRTYSLVRCETLHERRRSLYRMDVYCRFCGALILGAISSANTNVQHLGKVVNHTTKCAVMCMAGVREMRNNDHKTFLDEDATVPDR